MQMLLACGSMDLDFGPGFQVLILVTALLWLAGLIAAIVNLVLMAARPINVHPGDILFWLGCLGFGGLGWKMNQLIGGHSNFLFYAYIYGVPALPLVHFVSLFQRYRATRLQTTETPAPQP